MVHVYCPFFGLYLHPPKNYYSYSLNLLFCMFYNKKLFTVYFNNCNHQYLSQSYPHVSFDIISTKWTDFVSLQYTWWTCTMPSPCCSDTKLSSDNSIYPISLCKMLLICAKCSSNWWVGTTACGVGSGEGSLTGRATISLTSLPDCRSTAATCSDPIPRTLTSPIWSRWSPLASRPFCK